MEHLHSVRRIKDRPHFLFTAKTESMHITLCGCSSLHDNCRGRLGDNRAHNPCKLSLTLSDIMHGLFYLASYSRSSSRTRSLISHALTLSRSRTPHAPLMLKQNACSPSLPRTPAVVPAPGRCSHGVMLLTYATSPRSASHARSV